MPYSSATEYPQKYVQKTVGNTDTEFFGAGETPMVSHIVLSNTSGGTVTVDVKDGEGNVILKSAIQNNRTVELSRGFQPTTSGLLLKGDSSGVEATVFAFGSRQGGASWQ